MNVLGLADQGTALLRRRAKAQAHCAACRTSRFGCGAQGCSRVGGAAVVQSSADMKRFLLIVGGTTLAGVMLGYVGHLVLQAYER